MLLYYTFMLQKLMGIGLSAIGGVTRYNTEMMNGYLTPIVKLVSAGSGTESDLYTLYNVTTFANILLGVLVSVTGF